MNQKKSKGILKEENKAESIKIFGLKICKVIVTKKTYKIYKVMVT